MANIKEGLKYSESHEWVKVDGDIATIGVSDYAQAEMGDITYVDLPDVDDEFQVGEEFGALESVKASSDLFAPVSGIVTEINEELENAPELINQDAYTNWIIRIKMNNMSELDSLMNAEEYAKHTNG
ncbi:MAG: glycine cleavage system protein GcvH [Bacteroidaceae bacterium]|nr:glycine cleavage system protein GcvH [Bacteroidaceae bacterium]